MQFPKNDIITRTKGHLSSRKANRIRHNLAHLAAPWTQAYREHEGDRTTNAETVETLKLKG